MTREDFIRQVFGAELLEIRETGDNYPILVCQNSNPEKLTTLKGEMKGYKKWYREMPVIVTTEFLDNARDSYPADILFMRETTKHSWGRDVFAEVMIQDQDLRLNVERELRSALFSVTHAFLSVQKPKELYEFLSSFVVELRFGIFGFAWLQHYGIAFKNPAQMFTETMTKSGYSEAASLDAILRKKLGNIVIPFTFENLYKGIVHLVGING